MTDYCTRQVLEAGPFTAAIVAPVKSPKMQANVCVSRITA